MKMIKKEKKVETAKVFDFEKMKKEKLRVNSAVEEYYRLTQQEKTIKSRKSELADIIKSYAVENGAKDDKGSYYCEDDKFIYGRQSSTSIVEKENIIELLNDMELSDCVDTVQVVNRNKLDEHYKGDITDSDLKELFDIKENTPRVYVKLKEAEEKMPEVQQGKVARRKGKK